MNSDTNVVKLLLSYLIFVTPYVNAYGIPLVLIRVLCPLDLTAREP